VRYHDEEWGRPLHGDDALFERLCLEAFQSGPVLDHHPAQAAGVPAPSPGSPIDAVAAFTPTTRHG
jgi:DNA-3-methyladenine glycosylase I